MFDKLIEILIRFWKDLMPYVIVEEWNEAIHLRFGKYIRNVPSGIHFKIPLIDDVLETPVITQSVKLPTQTLTTLDEQTIVLRAIIRYHIVDVKKFLLTVMHANDVLIDTTMGFIRDAVEITNWEDLENMNEYITNEVKGFVIKWGIMIEVVTVTDLSVAQTHRIFGDDTHKSLILPTEQVL